MGKVVLKIHTSLDGYVGTTTGDVDWIFPTFDDEQTAWEVDLLWQAGVHVMGTQTYLGMAAHWPTSDEPFAAPMNQIPKAVFSTSLDRAEWGETTVVRGDLATEIARLRATNDKDVLVHGGARLAQDLGRLGLVDRYHLLVHPVVLGDGLPLFAARAELRCAGVRPFPGGSLLLTYDRP